MFRNPFYYGVFLHKGEMHQGVHAPMISKKTFDEIQAALVTIGKPRKKRGDKGFLFLNFATCGTCGHCITGERHTKKSGRRYHSSLLMKARSSSPVIPSDLAAQSRQR
jgi:hypothetical protein